MSVLLEGDRHRSGDSPDRVRLLIPVAFAPAGTALVLISTVTLVTLVSANNDLAGAFGAVASIWLAIHQVQLTIDGVSLGVLPLLPTLVLGWATARRSYRVCEATSSRRELLFVIGAAVGGPIVVTAIALAVVQDASTVFPISPPNALSAFAWAAFVHGSAAGTAVLITKGRILGAEFGLPDWAWTALRLGTKTGILLVSTGAVLTTLALLQSWPTVGTLIGAADGFTGELGLTVLSILYLPNVAIGAAAILVGSSAQIGAASFSLFDVVGGSVPALPVLGVAPAGPAGGPWLVLLAVPAVLAVQLGRKATVAGSDSTVAWKIVLAAAAGVGSAMSILGFVAGGALGAFGSVGVPVVLCGLTTAVWLALVGSATVLVLEAGSSVRAGRRRRGNSQEAKAAEPDQVDVAGDADAADADADADADLDSDLDLDTGGSERGEQQATADTVDAAGVAATAASGQETVTDLDDEPAAVAESGLESEPQASEQDLPTGAQTASD